MKLKAAKTLTPRKHASVPLAAKQPPVTNPKWKATIQLPVRGKVKG